MNIIIAILIFSLIVVIHELGHFLLAKANGVFVTEFSIGMGPRIISLVKTEKGFKPKLFLNQRMLDANAIWTENTMYSWKVLPIGGSCMMLGEDENIDDDRAFNKKGVWARISVIFAGPFFNFILAFLLAMFVIGMAGYDSAKVGEVNKNSPAEVAGIHKGDLITKINDTNVDISREFYSYLQFNPINKEDVSITYMRNGKENTVSVSPVKQKIYWLGFNYSRDKKKAIVTEIYEDTPLSKTDMKANDIIVKINDTSINNGDDLYQYFEANPLTDKPITITYSNKGNVQSVQVTPKLYSNDYKMGISLTNDRVEAKGFKLIKYSAVEVKYTIVSTIDSLGMLIAGKVGTDQMAGPVGIVSMLSEGANRIKSINDRLLYYISFCILLTANLGVMNLLPIPALDGGRLVFLFIEAFRRKPIDQSKEGFVHMIGFVLLMILMAFVMFNDIRRLLGF